MTFWKKKQTKTLCLGTGLSVLLGLILSNIPQLQKWELKIQDRLIRLFSPKNIPKEILLVNIKEEDLGERSLALQERAFYANLVHRLIEQGASVVILNLPHEWTQPPDRDWIDVDEANSPIKELVKNHGSQIVLVTPTTPLSNQTDAQFPIYNHFLPFEGLEPSVPPEEVQGFFEYSREATNPKSLKSSARRASLYGKFMLKEDVNQVGEFKSAAILALEKHPNKKPPPTPTSAIAINFFGATGSFKSLDLKSICPSVPQDNCTVSANSEPLAQVRNKIVLVGFDELPIKSPFGEDMPAVEVQANLLASLMRGSFYQIPPNWLEWVIIVSGAVLISGGCVLGSCVDALKRNYQLFSGAIIGGYGLGIMLVCFYSRLILPLLLPLFTWVGTGTLVTIFIYIILQKELIAQQECEIAKLKATEQEAVISHTRKLLQRTANDIHDGPLQELKLIMDEIELNSTGDILDQLEDLGHDIRQHLNNIRTMALKLEVTPELQEGLDVGMRMKLEQLVKSGELTLKVIQDIQPLFEPKLNSAWIDGREDIYRFFREAIANVIRHAQPPKGNATQVKISLSQKGERCMLLVENDGTEFSNKGRCGGLGTKLMEAIAKDLPGGTWERVALASGGIRVKLSWFLANC